MKRLKKRKGIEAQRVKRPIPFQAIDALIGDEEQNRKLKRTKRKKWSGSPAQLPWTIQSPPYSNAATPSSTPRKDK